MAELADALDLGSSAARLAGSTPVTRTIGESVRTIRTYIYESIRNDWFFRVLEKIKKFYNYSTRNINLQGDYRVEIKSHNDKKNKKLNMNNCVYNRSNVHSKEQGPVKKLVPNKK